MTACTLRNRPAAAAVSTAPRPIVVFSEWTRRFTGVELSAGWPAGTDLAFIASFSLLGSVSTAHRLWVAGWGRHVESQRSGRRHDEFADEDGGLGAFVADEVDEAGHLDVGVALGVRRLGAVVGVEGDCALDDDHEAGPWVAVPAGARARWQRDAERGDVEGGLVAAAPGVSLLVGEGALGGQFESVERSSPGEKLGRLEVGRRRPCDSEGGGERDPDRCGGEGQGASVRRFDHVRAFGYVARAPATCA